MRFLVLGCSFRTAPVDIRERLAFPRERLSECLAEIKEITGVREAVLLSTCNRVELYTLVDHPNRAEGLLKEYLSKHSGLDSDAIATSTFCYVGDEALKHIFRVTSSLDAMVVGEAQVAGQVKEAFAAATDADTVGPMLSRCMQRAFGIAKRVRTETDIARHPASISSVAVDLAKRVFDDIAGAAILVIGAGEMAELAVRHLIGDGASRIHVANRSLERGQKLADDLGAKAVLFEQLEEHLIWADVVISSTGSREPIISRDMLFAAMKRRKQRPIFMVDIAVPRDIDADAGRLANVYLFAVDDLEKDLADNLAARRKEAVVGEEMVLEEVELFLAWLRTQNAAPVIRQLRQHFTEVVKFETDRTAKRLQTNGQSDDKAMKAMADAIVKKLLHGPMIQLKRSAGETGGGTELRQAVRLLFELDEPTAEIETEREEL
jgi:glutamyl-tRNA reductase